MPKTAIYPCTFDPITFGHIDVIKKSLKIVDKLIVATTDKKTVLFEWSIAWQIDHCMIWSLILEKFNLKVGKESLRKI